MGVKTRIFYTVVRINYTYTRLKHCVRDYEIQFHDGIAITTVTATAYVAVTNSNLNLDICSSFANPDINKSRLWTINGNSTGFISLMPC